MSGADNNMLGAVFGKSGRERFCGLRAEYPVPPGRSPEYHRRDVW